MQKLYCFLLVTFGSVAMLAAQHQYLFEHLGVRDGLASDNVMSVQQDPKGYIWIATTNGLQRYDGQKFITFRHLAPNSGTFPDGVIHGLQIDKKGRLWMLFAGFKAGYLNTADLTFHEIPLQVPKQSLIRSRGGLYIDHNDNVLLIVINYGTLTFDETARVFAVNQQPFQLPPQWKPWYVWQDVHEKNYWIGCDSGLVKYNPGQKSLSYRDHNAENDKVINAFAGLTTVVFAYFDQARRFWITAWPRGGLQVNCYYSATDKVIEWQNRISASVQHRYNELRGVTELKDGTLWMSGRNLLARIDSAGTGLEHIFSNQPGEYSIRYDDINQLFEDREKNIWISSDKGLFRFNPSSQLFKAIPNKRYDKDSAYTPDVTDLLQTKNGEILVSTWGNGIFSYDKSFNPIKSPLAVQSVKAGEGMPWCLHQHSNGDIWRGNQGGTLFIYHSKTNTTEKIEHPFFEKSTIRQISEDKNGNLWFGTQRGYLVKWDASTNRFSLMHKFQSIIPRIITDSSGFLWVCTEVSGVYKINPDDGRIVAHYTSEGPQGKVLRSDYVADIIQYNDSIFVIACNGLNFLNTKSNNVQFFTTENGLPTNDISNLILDRNGYIWMSTGSGVISYTLEKRKLSHYTSQDGVHSNSFNIATAAMMDDGRIAFGTAHDMLVFDPDQVTIKDYEPPRVEITGFSLMNKSLRMDSLRKEDILNLNYDQNSVVIELSTLTFQNLYPIYYMLEGLDKNWITSTDLKQAIYTYLPPGKYTFKTGCRHIDGKMGELTTMSINITSPFWKTWWFYCLLALCGVGILFWLDRERMQRLRREQQMRSAIAGNLHDQVNNALQNINVLSEIAGMKADTQPEQSKQYIYEIQQKSRNMVVAMNDVLWSIDPANDSMSKAVVRLREVAHAMSNGHATEVDVQTDQNILKLNLDMKKRLGFITIFKLAMLTLVKELRSPQITVQLDYNKSLLQLKIFSPGITLPKSNCAATRHVTEMKNHALAIQAALDVQSDEKGTGILLGMKL